MLSKLRWRIVLTVMAVAAVIMALAIAGVLVIARTSSYEPIRGSLLHAVEQGADLGPRLSIGPKRVQAPPIDGPGAVAVVLIDSAGTVRAYNGAFLAMDPDIRSKALAAALADAPDEGLLREQGLFYLRQAHAAQTTVAFADATAFVTSMRDMTSGAFGVGLATLAAVCALAIMLARAITRPAQHAWDQQARFVADASHELKTPLTVILANADILRSHPELTVGEQTRWVEGIAEEGRGMKALVEEMLFLARAGETPHASGSRDRTCDMTRIVRQTLLAFDAVAFEAQVELVDEVQEGAQVAGDEAQLERLARTLVDNAVKYAGSGGRATVRLVSRRRGHVTLAVSNTGSPIAPEDLPHVFDRFWRSDAARTRTGEGSYGLGLAIAKSIAEGHGGTIEVTSCAEEGTTFTVRI